jgi:hypothetical protein
MDLSIIIVNHNTKKLTAQTIDSVLKTSGDVSLEIIVADNSSRASEVYESTSNKVRVVPNIANKGFGHACNIGVNYAVGRYILFLNSDTLMQENTLRRSIEYMDANSDIGCLGVKNVLTDGSVDSSGKRGFPTPFNSLCYLLGLSKLFPKSKRFGGYKLSYLSDNEINDVDSVSGAFMLIPKSVLNRVGLFDESIFMYGEDIDLCYRIKQSGLRVVYYPEVFFIHLKGQSGLRTKNTAVIRHFHNGLRIFYDKYYKERYGIAVTLLVHFGIEVKYALSVLAARLSK